MIPPLYMKAIYIAVPVSEVWKLQLQTARVIRSCGDIEEVVEWKHRGIFIHTNTHIYIYVYKREYRIVFFIIGSGVG